jgi:repressor LexA
MRYQNTIPILHTASNYSKMNRIKEVLTEKGIKQIWLAEKLDKSYNMVNSYAQNRRQPSIEDLYKIAAILEVDPRELLSTQKLEKNG